MRNKIGTVLEASLVARAKELAGRTGKPLSKVLETALAEHLRREMGRPVGISSVEATFGAIRPAPRLVAQLDREDVYGTE